MDCEASLLVSELPDRKFCEEELVVSSTNWTEPSALEKISLIFHKWKAAWAWLVSNPEQTRARPARRPGDPVEQAHDGEELLLII